jgi:hypothetical protein
MIPMPLVQDCFSIAGVGLDPTISNSLGPCWSCKSIFIFIYLFIYLYLFRSQEDLDEIVNTWNRHLIRPSRNARIPSGRPNIMYNLPELYGTVDYISQVSSAEINICKGICTFRQLVPCDQDVYDLCWEIIGNMGYNFPHDPYSAVDLYLNLRHDVTLLL